MGVNFSAYSVPTVLLAFLLAVVYASAVGVPRLKMPGETELTVAKGITNKLRRA